ncbi:MAG: MFS transporter [Chloroflexi bacterium]|nr:MFS transporter [Chloroflexota bacterium]
MATGSRGRAARPAAGDASGMRPGAPEAAGPPSVPADGARFGALRHRNFLLFWIGLITSNTGTWMQLVAQGFLIYDLTGSKAMLGLVGLARAIPMILFPLFGGVVADRVDRIRLLWVTQSAQTLLALGLAVLTSLGLVEPWHIVTASFLGAVAGAFDQPARQALLPQLVPKADLLSATSLNSAVFNGAAFTGPAIYGLAAPFVGIAGAFYLNAASYGAVFIALALIRLEQQAAGVARGNPLQNLLEGLRYVRGNQTLSTLVVLAAVASFFGRSYTFLLPALVKDVLAAGQPPEIQLISQSYLTSAAGLGTLIGAFGLAGLGTTWRKGRLLFGSALLFTVLLACFGLSPVYWVSVGILVGVGLMNNVFSSTTSTLLQVLAPGHLRGRVMSLYTLCFLGFSPLGAGLIGPVAELIGAPTAIVLGAAIIAATVAAMLVARPHMKGVQ